MPVSNPEFDPGTELQWLKASTIAVFSRELAMTSKPAAEVTIAAEVRGAIETELDRTFIDPSVAGSALVSPASVTYGAPQFASSGSDVGAIDADLLRMLEVLLAAGMTLASAWWVMSPMTAARLSLKRSNGALAYPGISAKGGMLAGLPVATSSVCTRPGSPTDSFIALIECDEIVLADDNEAELSFSENAGLQMNDSPSSGHQPLLSVWQTNNLAIRATRWCNWMARRDGAAVSLVNVQY